MITNSELITPFLIGDFDENDKLVTIEIRHPDKFLPCHFYNSATYIDNKPPFSLTCNYDAKANNFEVKFIDDIRQVKEVACDDYPFIMQLLIDKFLVGLKFANASQNIKKKK